MGKKDTNGYKDWEIAQMMFGKNNKEQCKIVASLRKHGVITPLDDVWNVITDSRLSDDCGWLIPNIEGIFSDKKSELIEEKIFVETYLID